MGPPQSDRRRHPLRRGAVLVCLVLLAVAPAGADLSPQPPASGAYHERTILVSTDRPTVHALVGTGAVVNRIEALGIDVVAVAPGTVGNAVAAYEALGGVRWAEPNWVIDLAATPDDPLLDAQWGLHRIGVADAWAHYGPRWAPPGGGRLAIVDTGIDRTHPEFRGTAKVTACRTWTLAIGLATAGCQDQQGHGTHVAGIAAALAGNGRGIAGVAPDAELLVLKAFGPTGHGFSADIAAAIVYATDHGAQVANYSFSLREASTTQAEAVAYADSRDVVQIAAAGNDRRRPLTYPARDPRVVSVAASAPDDTLASFSAHGADVAAPGQSILSTAPGRLLYTRMSGTSMAAPHVAGLAALVRATGTTAEATRRAILDSAVVLDGGVRLVHAGRTLSRLEATATH